MVVVELGGPHEGDRERAERLGHRSPLREGRGGDAQGDGRPDHEPDEDRADQEVDALDLVGGERRRDADGHPESGGPASPPGGLDVAHEPEREDEEDYRRDVEREDVCGVEGHFAGFPFGFSLACS